MDSSALQFELREELGAGATGRVHRAVLTAPWEALPAGHELAVKVLDPRAAEDPLVRESFEREARVALELRAPGLLRAWAAGRDARGDWIAFEYLPGRDLRALLADGAALPEPLVRQIAQRLAGALHALELGGWLHGDLKPENVRLDKDGRAVLIDLGFVRPLGAPLAERARIAGSLPYLSPEEARGEPATPSAEVFSLGVLLYELVTGRHPFLNARHRKDGAAALRALSEARFTPPSLLLPTITPFLDQLLAEMLDVDPARRPSVAAVHARTDEQERGAWWREVLDRSRLARRQGRVVRGPDEVPLVGRERELAALLDAARVALTRPAGGDQAIGGVVDLLGDGGSGKSRLVREFASLVRRSEDPPVYLYGRCRELEDQRPCQPILTVLHRFLRLPVGTAPAARERELLEGLLPSDERETLLAVLDPEFDGPTAVTVPAALAGFLTALARRMPLVLFLDDVAWADEGTLEVLRRLLESLPGLALLLVLGRRPDAPPRRPAALARLAERIARLPFHRTVELGPLTLGAVRQLVDALFAKAVPRVRLAQVLLERSRGNPGLVAELLRGLRERHQLEEGPEGLVLLVHPDDLPLPASLREEIAAAYERLSPLDRIWLSRLSVAGGRIQPEFLERAWPRDSASELEETLVRLTRAGWLTPAADRYRFRRPALREAVYKSLDPERRKALHAEVARALRAEPGGRLSIADALQRAFHLRAAEAWPELLGILRPLLARLADRGQPQRVHTLSLWGLDALAAAGIRDARASVEYLVRGIDAADLLGRREEQRRMLDRLGELDLDPSSAPYEAGMVYLLHARYSISVGQYGPARGMLRAAAEHFEAARDDVHRSECLRRLSYVAGHVGDLEEARRVGRQALAIAPDDNSRAQCHLALGTIDLLEDEVEPALRRADRCLILLRKAQSLGAIAVRARANSLRARVYRGAGRPRRALVSAQRALRFAQRSGDRRLEVELRARLGVHLLDLDRVDEAESTLRDALLAAAEIEDRRGEAIAAVFLGILLAEQEDDAADAELGRAARLAQALGLNRVQAVALAIQARRALWRDAPSAVGASTRAFELVERHGAELIDRVVITGTHALILDRAGEAQAAGELIRALRKRMRAENQRIASPLLKRRHRLATTRLLEAVLSPDGPVYRRVRLPPKP
ncbi:MAG: AAA family ATPase [Planctomycetes bacterium]|nr:AAA family ATPase [Planctomycetota bacterium]